MGQKHKDQEANIPVDALGPLASLKSLDSLGKWASNYLPVSTDLTSRDATRGEAKDSALLSSRDAGLLVLCFPQGAQSITHFTED